MTEAKEFIGMSKFGAQALAESRNMIFRLLSVDGEEYFKFPEDKRDDRVCVDIVDSRIVKAVLQ